MERNRLKINRLKVGGGTIQPSRPLEGEISNYVLSNTYLLLMERPHG